MTRPLPTGLPPLPTTLVGSWSQPGWLIDRARLDGHVPVRVTDHSLWRVADEHLAEAQRDATALAVAEQERVGLDIVTDGEARRESYSNRFANALSGIDRERPGEMLDRTGKFVPAPRVSSPIERQHTVEADVIAVMRQMTDRPLKVTLPGPFTMTQQAQNDYYPSAADLAMAFADAVAGEIADLFAGGCDIVQIDEPYLQARPGPAAEYAIAAIDRAVADAAGPTVLHICFGYGRHVPDKPARYDFLAELARSGVDEISIEAAQPRLDLSVLDELGTKRIQFGVLDLRDTTPETPEIVATRIEAALDRVAADRLVIAPDCGCKYLPRDVAWAKTAAMVEGARRVRSQLTAQRS